MPLHTHPSSPIAFHPKEQIRYDGYMERLDLNMADAATQTATTDLRKLVAPQAPAPDGRPLDANLDNLELFNDLLHATKQTKRSPESIDAAVDQELTHNANHYDSLTPTQLQVARAMVRRSVIGHQMIAPDGTTVTIKPRTYLRALKQNAAILRDAQAAQETNGNARLWTKIRYPGAYASALVSSNGLYAQQRFKERFAIHRRGATDPEIKAGTAGAVIAGIVVLYGLTRSIIALKHGLDAPDIDLQKPHIDTPSLRPHVDIPTPPPKVTLPKLELNPDTPRYHVVKGDTLSDIARDTLQDARTDAGSTKRITEDMVRDVSRRIAAHNHIHNPNRIYPGQHLNLAEASHKAHEWFGSSPKPHTPVTPDRSLADVLPSSRTVAERIDEYRIKPGQGLYQMLEDFGIEGRRTQSAVMHELQSNPAAHHALTSGSHPFMYDHGTELRLNHPGVITEAQERRFADIYQRYIADRTFHDHVMRRLLDETSVTD